MGKSLESTFTRYPFIDRTWHHHLCWTDSSVFISTNGGDVLTRTVPLPGSPWFVDALAIFDGKLFAGTGGNGVFVSLNNRQTWNSLYQGLAGLGSSQIISFAVRSGVFYVGTRGASVFQLQQNIWNPFGDLASQVAGNVEFLDINGDTLVAGAGGNGYIWYASDAATSWTGVRVAPLQAQAFMVNSITTFLGSIYIGTTYGVFRSNDNIISWIPSSEGIHMNRIVKLISVGDTLYASASSAVTHLYRSTDGLNWTLIEQMPLVYAHVFHANRLYNARLDGLWYRQLLSTSVEQSYPIPQRIALKQNYPNPFDPSTTISYEIPRQNHIMLKVFEMLGREVAILVNEVEDPGYKLVLFNAVRLTSGVYFYRLQTETLTETKRLILLR